MNGKKIKKIRISKGISLSELAEQSGISKSYLSSIERNLKQNPSIQVIGRIAAVLEIDINQIIDFQSNQPQIDNAWQEFINEATDAGIGVSQLEDYKELINYIKWKNRKVNDRV